VLNSSRGKIMPCMGFLIIEATIRMKKARSAPIPTVAKAGGSSLASLVTMKKRPVSPTILAKHSIAFPLSPAMRELNTDHESAQSVCYSYSYSQQKYSPVMLLFCQGPEGQVNARMDEQGWHLINGLAEY